jgi:hypothetical protein
MQTVPFLPTGTPSKVSGDFVLRVPNPNPGGTFSVIPNPQADAFYRWTFAGSIRIGPGNVDIAGLAPGDYATSGLPVEPLDVCMYPAPPEPPRAGVLRRMAQRLAEILHRR